jgi:hypothetical protein
MAESRQLQLARQYLAEAEGSWASDDGLARLHEGLGCLDDIIGTGPATEARTAGNLAASYANRVYARIRTRLARDAQVPEPELERYFNMVLAFDQVREALPSAADELKIAVVRALIERYYEGYPAEKKRQALEQLTALRSRD